MKGDKEIRLNDVRLDIEDIKRLRYDPCMEVDCRSAIIKAVVVQVADTMADRRFASADVVMGLKYLTELYWLDTNQEVRETFNAKLSMLGEKLRREYLSEYLGERHKNNTETDDRKKPETWIMKGMIRLMNPAKVCEAMGVFGEAEEAKTEIEKFAEREDSLGDYTRQYQAQKDMPETFCRLTISLQDKILHYQPVLSDGYEECEGLRYLLREMMGEADYLEWVEEHKDRLDYLAGKKEAFPTDVPEISEDIRRLAENDRGTFGDLAKRVISHLQCHAMDLASEAKFLPTHIDPVEAEEITEKLKELMVQCCSPDSAKNKENRRLLQVMLKAMIGKEATLEWLASPDCPTILSPDPTGG